MALCMSTLAVTHCEVGLSAVPRAGTPPLWWRRWMRILPMSIPAQHVRSAFSIDSPLRMTDTPQSERSNCTPVYGVAVGVMTVCGL